MKNLVYIEYSTATSARANVLELDKSIPRWRRSAMLPRVRSLRASPCADAWWARRSRRAPCAGATRSPRAPTRASCTSPCPSLSAGTAGLSVMRMGHANQIQRSTFKLITNPLVCLLELLLTGVRLESQRLDQFCKTNNFPLLNFICWHLNSQMTFACEQISLLKSFPFVYKAKTTNLHNGETRRGFLSFETKFRYGLLVGRDLPAHSGGARLELLDAHVAQLDFTLRALDLCSEHLSLARHRQVVRWFLSKQSLMDVCYVWIMLPQRCNLICIYCHVFHWTWSKCEIE